MKRLSKTGLDVAIYWRSVIWLMDCPFDKAVKPDLEKSSTEMREFHDKLEGIWIRLRDQVGIDNAREATVPVTFSSQEVRCLSQCLHAVLAECDGDRTAASGKGSRIKGRVQRIKQEVEMLRSAFLWITTAKEIENYIPGSVWSTVYDVDNVPDPNQYDTFPSNSSKNSDFVQRHLKRKTFDKCDFAMKAVQHIELSAIERRFELDEKMLELVSTIKKWNE